MIKSLSLAAALALLPLSTALAQDAPQRETAAEAALEAAGEAFGARMEAFGERAEAIGSDESLSEAERDVRLEALWTQYAPAIAEFTAMATAQAGAIAAQALADIDVDALVAEAMADADVQAQVKGAMNAAHGIATNGAWASNDPEHMATYGLIAEYALAEAMDTVEDATETDEPDEDE